MKARFIIPVKGVNSMSENITKTMTIGNKTFDLHNHTYIMGILNVTPDSFSDGGRYYTMDAVLRRAEQMIQEGAHIIDIGGESTRPGHTVIGDEEEIARVAPAVEAIAARFDIPISVDTYKPVVAEAALKSGAHMVNDIWGLQYAADTQHTMAQVIAKYDAGLVLMHMRGTPETMQNEENLLYQDLIGEINSFFEKQIDLAVGAGIRRDRITLDPGVGFAKTVTANWQLVRDAEQFRKHGLPLYYGISRKSFLGREKKPCERDFATAGVLAYLTEKKVEFVRVHEPGAAEDAMRAFAAAMNGGYVK